MPARALRDDLNRYVVVLVERFGADLVSVVLFGSRARGETRPDSDIDLLVVIRGLPRRRFERYDGCRDLARAVSGEFGRAASPILLTPEEAEHVKPYYLGMLSGHEILHDRDDFFAGVLDRLRRRLAELGSRRYVDRDGYEYWDLKPDWKPGDIVRFMTSDGMARDYLHRARARRIAVEALFGARGYADVVRESQDLIELVLKGALRFAGLDPPKRHDVHAVLEAFIDRFPPEWRETLGELRQALDRLAADRAPAFYGDEAEGVPASDLFGEDDARRAMSVADRLFALYARLLGPVGPGG